MKTLSKFSAYFGFGLGAFLVARGLVRAKRRFDYFEKVVLITGGSRRLGLVLARKLSHLGSRIAICARDRGELGRAVAELREQNDQVMGIVCDVRDTLSVQRCMNQVISTWGGIDILFNVAGIIEVGPFESMTESDFYNSMNTNCWGALHTIREALPFMKKQGWGRIVNIASLGGKRAVPHMLPYAASKFALVGLSSGLRAELAQFDILVSTVCPGLIRTGSPRQAVFKGDHRKEYAWFSIGDSLPLMSMSAENAAEKIIVGSQRGDAEIYLSIFAKLGTVAQSFAPNLAAEFMTLFNALLPSSALGAYQKRGYKGFESTSWASPSFLTQLSEKAAAKNNEIPPL